LLELRNITAGYDTGTVLRNVSIKVPDKAVVALLGPNGAGKTTLLRVASGLLMPRSGQILIDGTPITPGEATPEARAWQRCIKSSGGVGSQGSFVSGGVIEATGRSLQFLLDQVDQPLHI